MTLPSDTGNPQGEGHVVEALALSQAGDHIRPRAERQVAGHGALDGLVPVLDLHDFVGPHEVGRAIPDRPVVRAVLEPGSKQPLDQGAHQSVRR